MGTGTFCSFFSDVHSPSQQSAPSSIAPATNIHVHLSNLSEIPDFLWCSYSCRGWTFMASFRRFSTLKTRTISLGLFQEKDAILSSESSALWTCEHWFTRISFSFIGVLIQHFEQPNPRRSAHHPLVMLSRKREVCSILARQETLSGRRSAQI
jgi:hypothetical protein